MMREALTSSAWLLDVMVGALPDGEEKVQAGEPGIAAKGSVPSERLYVCGYRQPLLQG